MRITPQNSPIKITLEYVLTLATQEQLMAYYSGVDITTQSFCNPMREDKKPDCRYFYNRQGKLYMKDFARGLYDWIDMCMFKNSCNYPRALEIAASDMSNSKPTPTGVTLPTLEKSFKTISVIQRDWNETDLHIWSRWGITLDILKYYNVFCVNKLYVDGNHKASGNKSSPIYGYYFGDKEWKIYFPLRTVNKFYSNSDALQGYEQLPTNGEVVVITSSLKDVMLLRRYGYPAVAPNSETSIIPSDIIEELYERFTCVICFYDNDETGIISAKNLLDKHGIPYITTNSDAKDPTDYYYRFGDKRCKELITTKLNQTVMDYS